MKQTLTYQPHSYGAHACRLRVEGFPDVSSGQGAEALGIITGWSLDWVGHPQLEGRREHLQALMTTVIPYARHLLSGVPRAMGADDTPVSIGPLPDGGHQMQLRSSQPDTPPLEVQLDDAELADLVRVLDQCRLDPRIQLPLPVPPSVPLPARELRDRVPLHRRLSAPIGGLAALAMAAGASTLLPTPRPSGSPSPSSETNLKSAASVPSAQLPPPKGILPPPAQPAAAGAAPSASAIRPEERVQRLRRWLSPRTPTVGAGPSPQTWKLAVNPGGEVVAATPVDGSSAEQRSSLGLPPADVTNSAAPDVLLVRGVVTPGGYWELAPWYGW
ncbi:MAG: DUF4335 domain-containing protein [Cyanobacteriota bacterium]|jgi:Domain of unknown function (DUF4335)|nr:DUF4335 domain-containing protein [Cyanobacteriota bacterium]